MKNVFLDTSIYIANNFDFEGDKFNSILDLVSKGRIILYTTSITDMEIISNIEKKVEEHRSLVNSLKIGRAHV